MYAACVFSRPFAALFAVSRVCSAKASPELRRRRFIVFAVVSSDDMVYRYFVCENETSRGDIRKQINAMISFQGFTSKPQS